MPRRRAPMTILTALTTMAVLAGALGGPRAALAQAGGSDLEQARAKLDTLFVPLAEAQANLDRRTFDVGALGLELAFDDAEQIVEHVHSVVRFEPYRGVLRGAQGTLASGGGNAIDQALLTATLLFDAGYDTEIRGATLDDAQVSLLLAQVGSARAAPALSAASLPQLDIDLEELAKGIAAETQAILEDVRAADGLLADAVPSAGAAGTVIEEASRDYYWVAYRLSAGEPWSEAHPVFGSTPSAFAGLEASQTFDGQIPQELQHRFSFQVFIERRLGDELEVKPVTALWERPVANMYGVALTYANVPDGLEAVQDAGDTDALMAASSFFFPMLEGDTAPGGMAFDMLGNAVPPEEASSPYAALFQTVGGALGRAAGALSSLGFGGEEPEPTDDFVSLTAQWIEFTFTAPGHEPVTHRRMIVDRLGAEARANGSLQLNPEVSEREAFAALSSVHTFMLDPGRYAEEYVLDRALASVLAMRSFVDKALVCALEGTDPPPAPAEMSSHEAPIAPFYLFAGFQDAPIEEGVISYRPAPGMVVMSQRLDGTAAQVDVVTNPRWSLRTTSAGVEFDVNANRLAGVWETRVEALPLSRDAEPVIPAFAALAGGQGLVVLDGSSAGRVAELPLPFEARAGIAEDLARGYTVVVPTGYEPQGVAYAGWWRTDPFTGETLGRGGDGRGSAFLEYLTSFEVSVALTAGFTVYGVHQCTKIADARVAGCCIVQNVALAGVGVGIGVGVSLAFNTAEKLGRALVAFGALDVAGNIAGTFIPTICS